MLPDRPDGPGGPGRQAPGEDPAALVDLIRKRIRDVPDYPQPGISFKDITPLLADGPAFAAVISELAAGHGPVDKVAGIEARGFILAAPVATRLGAGFVPVRKAGKLPAATYTEDYQLEYGTATIEVHTDALRPGRPRAHRGRRAGHRGDRAGHRRPRAAGWRAGHRRGRAP